VEHTHFSQLRAHYLFDSLFCRPAEGHEKGAVENLVGYVRRNAQHQRCHGRDQTILEVAHYLPAIARKPRAVSHAAVVRQLPPIYATVREQLCGARRDGYREFAAILLLCQEFSLDQVTCALDEAHRRGCLQASAVRQLVLNQLVPHRPDPVAVPARLAALQLPLPNLAQYNTLISEVPV